ncbi:hypothetical protein Tco_0648071 [Tanacetum coccineum]
MHDVPIAVFFEDGLSMIATKLRRPIMLDAYTSTMCLESWGQRHTMEKIQIEYEWKPPRCYAYKIFGHANDQCLKSNKVNHVNDKSKEGGASTSHGINMLDPDCDEVEHIFDETGEEASYLQAFNKALLDEERFLKQQSKVEWIRVGDSNSNYFHKVIKSCVSRSRIDRVLDMHGNCFKGAWEIVGVDISNAVWEFFVTGKLLKEVNHTIIALIPKMSSPTRVNDYQPISCCNVLFKCISKIISNHIKDCLTDLVSNNQSAFVPGRQILNNILLTQELMHNYHLDRGPPSTSFSVSLNGSLYGFFKGKRGLRQGDPLSLYLFTCLDIINLCFADDLFLFAHDDVNSARIIMDALDEFKSVSGLVPSLPKSTAYFYNVLNHTKLAILNVLPFEEGTLPVKYLGVPLVSTRLVYRDWFLWCQGDMRRGTAKVAWEDVYLPKREGGLGIRSLEIFNVALITSHVWGILISKESLWVKWIHTHKLRGRNFWDFLFRGSMTWGWRKLL